MLFCICLLIGTLSLVMQFLVIWYGLKLFKIVGRTDFWSCEWKYYIIGNGIIFARRAVSLSTIVIFSAHCTDRFLLFVIGDELLAVAVSVLFLMFGKKLVGLFGSYLFKPQKEKD